MFLVGTYQLHSSAPVNSQSSCSYPGHFSGVMLYTSVLWDTKTLTTFTRMHSPGVKFEPGKSPSGSLIPAPQFTTATVDGISAYWLAHVPTASSASIENASQMSAMKHGYLVMLTSTGLTESQNEETLGIILRRL